MSESIEFQRYLESIRATYQEWWKFYTLTDAAGKQQRSKEVSPFFDFNLIVQTVKREERERQEEEIERFSVLEGLRRYADQQVLLVGRPGSGKSTALARLMLEEATNPRMGIPVLVELRYWQGSIEQLICNSLERHGLTVERLEAVLSRLLLLFDGVNELPSEEARSQLFAFRRYHPKLPMVFTTRDLSLGGDLGIEKKLEMQPLSEVQMREFVRSYLSAEHAEKMLRQLNDRLREFGQTPLLLWMLCEVIKQMPDDRLPSNLAGIFQSFTTAYEISSVRRHEVAVLKGDVKPLSDRRIWKKALKALAFLMMQGKTPVDFRVVIDRDEAERELGRFFSTEQFLVRDILDDLLKYHLLQNRRANEIEFRHQLIQEYYAAEALLEQLEQLLKLDGKQLKQEYLNFLKWTEPIALMMALADKAQTLRVIRLAVETSLVLGARLAGKAKLEFQDQTINLIERMQVPQRLKIMLLGMTIATKAIDYLERTLKSGNLSIRRRSIEALSKIRSEAIIPALIYALNDSDFIVRWEAINALADIQSNGAEIQSSEVVVSLMNLIRDDEPLIRDIAAIAIKRLDAQLISKHLHQALHNQQANIRIHAVEVMYAIQEKAGIELLLQAFEDTNREVGWKASHTLAKIYGKAAIDLLSNLLSNDNAEIRMRAAYSLGEIGGGDVVQFLFKAISDENFEVRRQAIEALGKIEKVDKASIIVPILTQALKDENFEMRIQILYALAKSKDQTTIELFTLSLSDENPEIRAEAAFALGEIGNDKLTDVLVQALDDENPEVRRQLISALGKIGDDTAIDALENALQDASFEVREEAAFALGRFGNNKIESSFPEDEDEWSQWEGLEKVEWERTEEWDEEEFKSLEVEFSENDEERQEDLFETVFENDEAYEQTYVPLKLRMALLDNNESIRYEDFGNIEKELENDIEEELEDIWDDTALATATDLEEFADPRALPFLFQCLIEEGASDVMAAILAIQENCKYYNYEIYQSYLDAQKRDRQTPQNSDPNAITVQTIERLTIMTDKAPTFNQQNATIGVNYAAEGSKIEFTQQVTSSEQNFDILLTDYQAFIIELQQKYPNLADAIAASQIIEVEAKLIEAQDQHRWQNFLNLKRLWNGGKKATVKVGEHFAENNVWAKGAIAFLEGISEDVK